MKKTLALMMVLSLGFVSCARDDAADSNLTAGMTKKFIKPGETTQTEVLEIFGPPNLVTSKSGKEVWTYDRISQEVTSSQGYLTIILAGYSKNKRRSSSRSVMLMIYFNKRETVSDYKLHVAKY